jgi:hypothetical protein
MMAVPTRPHDLVGYCFTHEGKPIFRVTYASKDVVQVLSIRTGNMFAMGWPEYRNLETTVAAIAAGKPVPQDDGVKNGVKVEKMTNGPWTCRQCGETRMVPPGAPTPSHEDCRRNPKNAILGALYPQGPIQLPAKPVGIDRALAVHDTETMAQHNANTLGELARAMGFVPGRGYADDPTPFRRHDPAERYDTDPNPFRRHDPTDPPYQGMRRHDD